jgi:hypothetical protein
MAKTVKGWPTKIPGGQLAKRPAPTAKRAEYFGEYWQMEPHAYVYEFGGQWWLSAGGGPTPKDLYTIGPFSSKASLVIALEDDVLDGYYAGEMWVGHQRVLRKMAPSAGWMIDELQGKKKKKPSGRARTVPRKTPEEWAAEDGIRILDPDGWRMKGAPDFYSPHTYAEYKKRMTMSTIMPLKPRKVPTTRPSAQDLKRMSGKQLCAVGDKACRAELRRRGRDPRTGKKVRR